MSRSTSAFGSGSCRAETLPQVMAPIWDRGRACLSAEIFRERVSGACATSSNRPEDYVNHSLYFEAKTFLNGLLVVDDKLAMAHGLERRVPFLDNDLVDFAMRLPARMKLGNLIEVMPAERKRTRRQSAALFRAHPGRQADPAEDDGALHSRRRG